MQFPSLGISTIMRNALKDLHAAPNSVREDISGHTLPRNARALSALDVPHTRKSRAVLAQLPVLVTSLEERVERDAATARLEVGHGVEAFVPRETVRERRGGAAVRGDAALAEAVLALVLGARDLGGGSLAVAWWENAGLARQNIGFLFTEYSVSLSFLGRRYRWEC